MYFTDFLKVLIRQLPIVMIGTVLVGAAGVVALEVVPTNYQANAQVLLLPPSEPIPEGEPVNPYLNLPGSLTLTSSLIAGAVTTPDAQRSVFDDGFESAYSTSVVPQTGPVIVVTVKDTDAAEALATRDEVVRRLASELREIQQIERVPEEQLIVAREFGSSREAEVLAGNRLRALGMVVVAGSVVTLLAAFAADRLRRRPRRRGGRGAEGPTAAQVEESDVASSVETIEQDVLSEDYADFEEELRRVGALPEVG